MSQTVPWGTHVEFVRRYEQHFLAASLFPHDRAALVDSIGSEIKARGTRRLLDCAAGTGFPALDLTVAADDLGLRTVHVCDGDRVTVMELLRQARERDIELAPLNPRLRTTRTPRQAIDDLVINWRDLDAVRGTYDYVMCRGNALAYADTWHGGDEASSLEAIRSHLVHMAAKVDAGGHLHIDAPWKLTPREGPQVVLDTDKLKITEQIMDRLNHREWLLHFTEVGPEGTVTSISFRRISSALTIHDVRDQLDELDDFDEIEPFQLEAERTVYGTIIARKVR